MKSIPKILAIAVILAAGSAAAATGSLGRNVTDQDGWVGWRVPMIERFGTACCHSAGRDLCDLDSKGWNLGRNDDEPGPTADQTLSIFVHVTHGAIDRARAFSGSCKLRNADQVRWIDPVAGADSVALLADSAANAERELASVETAAIALHADATATASLEKLADDSHARKLREQALFWLAQARGVEGAKFVERVATSDGDSELRANAVFDLSQANGFDGYASIRGIAARDKSDHVREQALFWMAQMGDARARSDILAAIDNEASDNVREQAVFALSQLKEGESDAALIALVRGNYPRKVKEKALFWLGQSGSTQALNFLDEVLTRHVGKGSES